jgi:hypothetical protein
MSASIVWGSEPVGGTGRETALTKACVYVMLPGSGKGMRGTDMRDSGARVSREREKKKKRLTFPHSFISHSFIPRSPPPRTNHPFCTHPPLSHTPHDPGKLFRVKLGSSLVTNGL